MKKTRYDFSHIISGAIHLGNITGNPRVELAYAVEADHKKWDVVREQWNLKYTKVN